MKGLLIKDYYLLTQNKRLFFFILIFCFLPGYLAGYMSFLGAVVALGTISYDEADNGMPFLMTLPSGRRTYVLSKYVLEGIVCAAFWIIAQLIVIIINTFKGTPCASADEFLAALAVLPAVIILLDIIIPLHLKYGAEKSRVILILVFAATIGVYISFSSITDGHNDALTAADPLGSIPAVLIIAAIAAICAAATMLSIKASIKVMNNKIF